MEEKKILTDEELDNVVGGMNVTYKKTRYTEECRDGMFDVWEGVALTSAINDDVIASFDSTRLLHILKLKEKV